MTERVLCVAAHPDDELGCGATLAKHVQAGDTVMVVVLSDGVASRGPLAGTDLTRRREFMAALDILGVKQNAFATYPDQQFDTVPLLAIVKDIEECVRRFEPSIVYTHWWTDRNRDHRIVCEAVGIACRPLPGSTVKRLLHFEVPGPGANCFEPNWFVQIDAPTLDLKLLAMVCYASEVRQFPHPRSLVGIAALANLRGASVGIELAEAFVLGRNVC